MNEVKRYDIKYTGNDEFRAAVIDPNGPLIRYEDYAALEQKLKAAEAKLAELVPDEKPDWDSEETQDIDYMEPSDVYRMGKDDGWNSCRAEMLRKIEEL